MAYGIKNRIGNNIRALREYGNLSRKELATEMDVTESCLSNYELGIRTPDIQFLNDIATYFGTTSDMLVNYDYSDLKPKEGQNFLNSFISADNDLFPDFKIDIDNCCFNKGYKYLLDIFSTESPMKNDYIQCEKMFKSAWKETQRKEAVANYVAMIFCRLVQMDLLDSPVNLSKIDYKKIIKKQYQRKQARTTNREEILAKYGGDLDKYISILKKDSEWSQLGDYYLALKYIFGISSVEIPLENSLQIGLIMMAEFCICNNKYAVSFFSFYEDYDSTQFV